MQRARQCEHCHALINALHFHHFCMDECHQAIARNTFGVKGIARTECSQKRAHETNIVTFYSKVLLNVYIVKFANGPVDGLDIRGRHSTVTSSYYCQWQMMYLPLIVLLLVVV
jgi:hypothetical protein